MLLDIHFSILGIDKNHRVLKCKVKSSVEKYALHPLEMNDPIICTSDLCLPIAKTHSRYMSDGLIYFCLH